MDDYNAGGTEFTMSSFAEDHMSREDLGVGASTQEWADLQNLGRELIRWDNLPMDSQARNKWSQVPPRAPDKKEPRPRSRGQKDRGKEISCFLGSTRVRMAKTTWRSPEYKRMDKLVKGDKTWTRRHRRDCREPSQGQVSIVECVMSFACPPEGQLMFEVNGNFLTPDHHVAKGRGKWSTAGALAKLDTDSTSQLTHMVYNIKLQSGGQIEIGNKVYAATLEARFDAVEVGQDPIYSAEPQDISKTSRSTPRDTSIGVGVQPRLTSMGCPDPKGKRHSRQKLAHPLSSRRDPGNYSHDTICRPKMDGYPLS